MTKEKYYKIQASKGQNDDILFHKTENGLVSMHLGYSEVDFTVKECWEMIEKLKQCIRD